MGLSNSYGGGWLPCAHAHDETLSWQSIQGSHPLLLRPAFLLIVESTKPQAWAASKAQGIEGLGAGEAREGRHGRQLSWQRARGVTVPVDCGAAQQRRLLATLASLDR